MNKYKSIVRTLTQPPRIFEIWINEWSNIIAKAQRREFPITIFPVIWFDNIFSVIRIMQPQ